MNWTRYKLLIISGVITLVVCGGLIFWILTGNSAATELENDIENLKRQQAQLTSADLYPSEANLASLKEEQEKVKERRDAIKTAMREGQIDAPSINRSVFGDYINNVVPEMRKAARASTKGGRNGVILRDPDFGMTEFLEGSLPSQRRINRLVVEIETIEHLAKVLFDAGISELIEISVVDEEEEQPNQRGFRTPGTFGTAASSEPPEEEGTDSAAENERERLFDNVTVKVAFRAYEDFVWETLNELLADPNQIAISSMSITNSNTVLWPDYLEPPSTTRRSRTDRRTTARRAAPQNDDLLNLLAAGTETAETERTTVDEKLPGLKERQKHIVGGDLLTTELVLEVFLLKPEEEQTQPEGA